MEFDHSVEHYIRIDVVIVYLLFHLFLILVYSGDLDIPGVSYRNYKMNVSSPAQSIVKISSPSFLFSSQVPFD